MYPSQVMKFASFSEGQHESQNGTITYLRARAMTKEKENDNVKIENTMRTRKKM